MTIKSTISRKEKEKLKRRKTILKSALYLFSKKGFFKTKMEEIAKKASLSKGLLYFYFTSKEEILEEIVKEIYRGFMERIEKIKAKSISPAQKLEEFIKFEWNFYKRNKKFANLIFELYQEEGYFLKKGKVKTFREVHLREKEVLKNIIKEGIEKGIFKDYDPELASFIVSAIFHFVFMKSRGIKSHEEILELFLKGILKK